MKTSILKRNAVTDDVLKTVSQLVSSIPWPQRRLAMAAVTTNLLDGKERVAESVFGWGRSTVALGMNELRTGINCVNDLSSRHKPGTEQKHPEMLEDIRAIMEPECQADPQLRSTLAYTNKTASGVRDALIEKGWEDKTLPTIRTI
jgi:hypothetical protein